MAEAKIAVRRAFHERLRSRELDVGVEAFGECEIALAGKARAKVGQAQGPVHLGIPASNDVERQALRRFFEHVDFERVILTPAAERSRKRLETLVAKVSRQLGTCLPRQLDDDLAHDFEGARLAQLSGECPDQRADDPGLDLALLE